VHLGLRRRRGKASVRFAGAVGTRILEPIDDRGSSTRPAPSRTLPTAYERGATGGRPAPAAAFAVAVEMQPQQPQPRYADLALAYASTGQVEAAALCAAAARRARRRHGGESAGDEEADDTLQALARGRRGATWVAESEAAPSPVHVAVLARRAVRRVRPGTELRDADAWDHAAACAALARAARLDVRIVCASDAPRAVVDPRAWTAAYRGVLDADDAAIALARVARRDAGQVWRVWRARAPPPALRDATVRELLARGLGHLAALLGFCGAAEPAGPSDDAGVARLSEWCRASERERAARVRACVAGLVANGAAPEAVDSFLANVISRGEAARRGDDAPPSLLNDVAAVLGEGRPSDFPGWARAAAGALAAAGAFSGEASALREMAARGLGEVLATCAAADEAVMRACAEAAEAAEAARAEPAVARVVRDALARRRAVRTRTDGLARGDVEGLDKLVAGARDALAAAGIDAEFQTGGGVLGEREAVAAAAAAAAARDALLAGSPIQWRRLRVAVRGLGTDHRARVAEELVAECRARRESAGDPDRAAAWALAERRVRALAG